METLSREHTLPTTSNLGSITLKPSNWPYKEMEIPCNGSTVDNGCVAGAGGGGDGVSGVSIGDVEIIRTWAKANPFPDSLNCRITARAGWRTIVIPSAANINPPRLKVKSLFRRINTWFQFQLTRWSAPIANSADAISRTIKGTPTSGERRRRRKLTLSPKWSRGEYFQMDPYYSDNCRAVPGNCNVKFSLVQWRGRSIVPLPRLRPDSE